MFHRFLRNKLFPISPCALVIIAGGTPGSVSTSKPLKLVEPYTNCIRPSIDIPNMIEPRRGAATCAIGHKMFLFGGKIYSLRILFSPSS